MQSNSKIQRSVGVPQHVQQRKKGQNTPNLNRVPVQTLEEVAAGITKLKHSERMNIIPAQRPLPKPGGFLGVKRTDDFDAVKAGELLGGKSLSKDECPPLYNYFCGLAPTTGEEAKQILAWCRENNLHEVLPKIQQELPRLLLPVNIKALKEGEELKESEELKGVEELQYVLAHPGLRFDLRVDLRVEPNEIIATALMSKDLQALSAHVHVDPKDSWFEGSSYCRELMKSMRDVAVRPQFQRLELVRTGKDCSLPIFAELARCFGRNAEHVELRETADYRAYGYDPVTKALVEPLHDSLPGFRNLVVQVSNVDVLADIAWAIGELVHESGGVLAADITLAVPEGRRYSYGLSGVCAEPLVRCTSGTLVLPAAACYDEFLTYVLKGISEATVLQLKFKGQFPRSQRNVLPLVNQLQLKLPSNGFALGAARGLWELKGADVDTAPQLAVYLAPKDVNQLMQATKDIYTAAHAELFRKQDSQ